MGRFVTCVEITYGQQFLTMRKKNLSLDEAFEYIKENDDCKYATIIFKNDKGDV